MEVPRAKGMVCKARGDGSECFREITDSVAVWSQGKVSDTDGEGEKEGGTR